MEHVRLARQRGHRGKTHCAQLVVRLPRYLILPVEGEEESPGPAVTAEPVERPELREIRVILSVQTRTVDSKEETRRANTQEFLGAASAAAATAQ